MAPRFSVTVARRCDPRVKALRGEVKKHFDRVVEELRHRGCEAGGIRLRAETGADHRVCERRFYRDSRMHWFYEMTMTSSSHGLADTARTRMFTRRGR